MPINPDAGTMMPGDDLPIDPEVPEPVDPVPVGPAPADTASRRTPRRVLAAVAAGGALGGPVRYGLGLGFTTAPHTFPVTTFVINVTGSFVLALLLVFILDIWPPTTYVRPFFCVGFLGAYTTFSTWMVDTDRLIAAGAYQTAAANLLLSLAAGIAATSLGLSVGRGVAAWRIRRANANTNTNTGAIANVPHAAEPRPAPMLTTSEPVEIGERG